MHCKRLCGCVRGLQHGDGHLEPCRNTDDTSRSRALAQGCECSDRSTLLLFYLATFLHLLKGRASSQSLVHTSMQCCSHLQLLSAFLCLCGQVPVGMLVLSHLFPCFDQLPLSNSKGSAHHQTVLVAIVCHAGLYHAMHLQRWVQGLCKGFCLCKVNAVLVVLSTVS